MNMFLKRDGFVSIVVLLLASVIILMLMLINILNYSVFSYSTMLVGRALDYAVCAAVQEIDIPLSMQGISDAFDESSGMLRTGNMFFDNTKAEKVFYRVLKDNSGLEQEGLEQSLTLVSTCPMIDIYGELAIKYFIKRENSIVEGVLYNVDELESTINDELRYGSIDKARLISVNGNPKTNEFSIRPYYIAIVKDFEVKGVISPQKVTYVAFRAGRINRRGE